jgi:trans-aconitate methyltransferase
MRNPWLSIPLSDYEAHMALPAVDQSRMLADELEKLLQTHRPHALAVIGCAGGNGFERIDPQQTPRVVGVDINPDYLACAQRRFEGACRSLELICADVQSAPLTFAPVDLMFAGLIFEYVDVSTTLANLTARLRPGGILAVLVQLPAAGKAPVTMTPFASLTTLSAIMRLTPPEEVIGAARGTGLSLTAMQRIEPGTGKRFQLLQFVCAASRKAC